jgi:hypothetical protein
VIGILFYKFYGKLGKGSYFLYDTGYQAIKCRKNKNIYLSDIKQIEYDDNFIIALRIPQKFFYECNSTTEVFAIPKLQYVIIDKKRDKIYATYDKNKFKKKVKNLNINLMFDNQDIKQANIKLEKKRHVYKSDKSLEYLKNNCKEDFIYPIEEF